MATALALLQEAPFYTIYIPDKSTANHNIAVFSSQDDSPAYIHRLILYPPE